MPLATVCDLPSLTLSDSEARHLHQFKKIANYQHVFITHRALSNNSPCNLNVIYPPGWTQSHHSSVSPPSFQKTAHFPDHIFLYHSETDLKNNGFSRQINTIVYSKCKK